MIDGSMNVIWNVSCCVWSILILNNNMIINVIYINVINGYKILVNVFSNGIQMLLCYKEFVNFIDKNIIVFYCNVMIFNKIFLLNMILMNIIWGIKICYLNIIYQNRLIILNIMWMYNFEIRNVSLNIMYLNYLIVFLGFLKNYILEKGICFNSIYFNGIYLNVIFLVMCLSYVNVMEWKFLIFNIISVNIIVMVNIIWFVNFMVRGILVNCSYYNRIIFNMMVIYFNIIMIKNFYFNFLMGNWSVELNYIYFFIEMLFDVDQICSINIMYRIKNGIIVMLNSMYIFIFFNIIIKKDIVFNFMFIN